MRFITCFVLAEMYESLPPVIWLFWFRSKEFFQDSEEVSKAIRAIRGDASIPILVQASFYEV